MSNTNTGSPQAVLSPKQAESIYMAMCHLNNVNGRLDVFIQDQGIHCREMTDGCVVIHKTPSSTQDTVMESYASQVEFASAYGL